MIRRALLIGNCNGLFGVQTDIKKYKNFLLSDCGGAWFENEICTLLNPSKTKLFDSILEIKNSKPFLCHVLFSGHGGYARETILEINENEECIFESNLKNIATRQINIFDCCRALAHEPLNESTVLNSSTKTFSVNKMREIYEDRIMQSIPQEINLYACSIGEKAYDSNDGAIYLKHLLNSAINLSWVKYKTVESVHFSAKNNTSKEKPSQNPEGILPKCLSSQQLILSINPALSST